MVMRFGTWNVHIHLQAGKMNTAADEKRIIMETNRQEN
jgi:hypothetical protein